MSNNYGSPSSVYSIRYLPNGFILVYDRASGLNGLYNDDGSYRNGDLRNVSHIVRDWLSA